MFSRHPDAPSIGAVIPQPIEEESDVDTPARAPAFRAAGEGYETRKAKRVRHADPRLNQDDGRPAELVVPSLSSPQQTSPTPAVSAKSTVKTIRQKHYLG